MSARDASLAKAFFLFLLVLALAGAVVFQTNVMTNQKAQATSNEPLFSLFPTPTPKDEKTPSSDGSKVLFLRSTKQSDGTVYSVFSSDTSGAGEHLLMSKPEANGTLEIPLNAWSPDDSYVFVKQRDTYYVLRPSGDAFAGGEHFLDVGAIWTQRKLGFTLREATGWASPTLLILYTTKEDGTKGPAYWFEVPSKALIQLAS